MAPSAIGTLILLAGALGAASIRGQDPDFSGTWAPADSPEGSPTVARTGDAAFRSGAMGSGWGAASIRLEQSGNRLSLEYVQFSAYDLQPPLVFTWTLDGAESRNTMMIGHAATIEVTRADWRGDTLILSTQSPGPDLGDGRSLSAEVRRSLHLVGTDTLVVETTRLGLRPGDPTRTSRSMYVRREGGSGTGSEA